MGRRRSPGGSRAWAAAPRVRSVGPDVGVLHPGLAFQSSAPGARASAFPTGSRRGRRRERIRPQRLPEPPLARPQTNLDVTKTRSLSRRYRTSSDAPLSLNLHASLNGSEGAPQLGPCPGWGWGGGSRCVRA